MKINFQKTKETSNKIFLKVVFMGGDADTYETVLYEFKKFGYSNYQDNLDEIQNKVNKWKLLKDIIGHSPDEIKYEEIREEHGTALADMFDDMPNDPTVDYQWKCCIDQIKLLAYDDKGNEYESYV